MRIQNRDYDYNKVVADLDRLQTLGHSHSEEDGTSLTEVRLAALKNDVWGVFTARKLGNAFGTNTYPWQDFGTDIPVLLVYDDDGQCVDAYPHNESHGTVTIMECLARVIAAESA